MLLITNQFGGEQVVLHGFALANGEIRLHKIASNKFSLI